MDPFYITSLTIIGLCVLYILICAVLIPLLTINKIKKELARYIKENSLNYTILKSSDEEADFKILINKKEYIVKVLMVKKNSDIIFQDDDTIAMYYENITKERKVKLFKDKFTASSKGKIIILSKKVNSITNNKNIIVIDDLNFKEIEKNNEK